jgi:hypothetical protein
MTILCTRAGIEMTKDEWLALPVELRRRYWQDTDWGNKPASQTMVAEVKAYVDKARLL